MTLDVHIVPARCRHIATIARRMRAADADECRAMAGLSPLDGLRSSMLRSEAYTALVNGQPEAMFGTSDINVLAGIGSAWLLGTDEVTRHPKEFLRMSREWLAKPFTRYSVLRNVVSVENSASIRWLKWLGATFSDPIDVGGKPFVLFELRKERCALN